MTQTPADAATPGSDPLLAYDALLLVSFGGPEGPDDVVPFLENVTRGRGIPRERLVEVGAHYAHFGGVSPINAQNRDLIEAVATELTARGLPLRTYWGNRNWTPYLADALRQMRADGVRRALAFVTSAYSSYSGCRQYRENLATAAAEVEADGLGPVPAVDVLRRYFDHPGFVEPMVDGVVAALGGLEADHGLPAAEVRLVFSTHSIPTAAAASSGPPGAFDATAGGAYVAEHRAVAALVATGASNRVGVPLDWDLVYQSRSGPPSVPWLEPDVSDHLEALAAQGVRGVVIVPVGFVSDHIEVLWDLDEVALATAARVGLVAARSATAGADPRFAAMVVDLVGERVRGRAPAALSAYGPWPDACPAGCCPNPRPGRAAGDRAPEATT